MRKSKVSTNILSIRHNGTKIIGQKAVYYIQPDSEIFCVSIRKKNVKLAVHRNKIRRWYKYCRQQCSTTDGMVVVVTKAPSCFEEVSSCWAKFQKHSINR